MTPKIGVLCTGEELLDGRVLNTNAHGIADRLFQTGFPVQTVLTVGDDPRHIQEAFLYLINKHDVVLSTGGLGPTDDDRTVACLNTVIQDTLVLNETALQDIRSYYDKTNRVMPEANIKQAYIPSTAQLMSNSYGTAPAFKVRYLEADIIVLPGVPREMKALLETYVLPYLTQTYPAEQPLVHTFKCFGLGESAIADLLKPIYPLPEGVQVAYQVPLPEVHVRLMAAPAQQADFQTCYETIKTQLGPYCYGSLMDTFFKKMVETLTAKKHTLAIAESCTGGLIAASIAAVPGASVVFERGIVAYSNTVKPEELGVDPAVIAVHGAVSGAVAEAMAKGVREKSNATFGIGVTGIAGPSGATSEKPVGTVVTAIAGPDGVSHKVHHLTGDRARIQKISSYLAVWPLMQIETPLKSQ